MAETYSLLIFDWDGTLMDSQARIVKCFQAAAQLSSLRIPAFNDIRSIIGLAMPEAVARLFPDSSTAQKSRLILHYRQQFRDLDDPPMCFFPNVLEGLQHLAVSGYRLAVATGKSRTGLNELLSHHGIESRFIHTRCADESKSKPHPQMVFDILSAAGIPGNQALVIGDTYHDLMMAANAGVEALAVSYGTHDEAQLRMFTSVGICHNFKDVVRWIGHIANVA